MTRVTTEPAFSVLSCMSGKHIVKLGDMELMQQLMNSVHALLLKLLFIAVAFLKSFLVQK